MPELALENGCFELHCHSSYSRGTKIRQEGTASPKQIVERAKKLGLAGIALTDHNSIGGWKEAGQEARKQDILFIPGLEVSTAGGHIIGLGLNEPVRAGLSVGETVEQIRAQGGLAVAPHPFDVRGKGIGKDMVKADAIEVFDSLALDRIPNWLCSRHARKLEKPLVAGSDAHSLDMIGTAVNVIKARDLDSLLREIRAGRVGIRARYIPLRVILGWTRERFTASRQQVLEHIGGYSRPKAWFARSLFNRFLGCPESWSWLALAQFGLGVTTVFSGLRAFRYYF